jgi:hypothetical protein
MKHFYLVVLFAFFTVNQLKAQSVAKFDDLLLSSGKYWNGSDLSGSFKSGDFTFLNNFTQSQWGDYWDGFAYSNITDNKTVGYGNQYSAITGNGYEGSANYAVCYPSPYGTVNFTSPTKLSGFYVTNSTYAYWSMKNGDLYAKKFGGESGNDPDYFKLMIEALDADSKPVDTVYFYLADFRSIDNSKDYILDKWTWVDLSEMKAASKVRFSLSSSDTGTWGMNTPAYFCIDNFNGEKPYDYKSVTYANFENIDLSASGYYNGSDGKTSFASGNFRFFTEYTASWDSWSGFAVSNKTDNTTPGWANQYSAITGKGVLGSANYAVAYPNPVSTIAFKDTTVSGVYVTNSTYAYLSMKNGDSYAKKFGGDSGDDPDWFLLTIEGFDSANKSTGKVYFNLADFAYSINSNDYIINTWRWVNLKSLGRISKLEFSLRSSDMGTWGMNTPGYFCLDNLNHEITTSVPEMNAIHASVFPNPFTDQIIISGFDGKANVSITDISGRKIADYTNLVANQVISDLAGLIPGIYFLKIENEGSVFTQKLVKR